MVDGGAMDAYLQSLAAVGRMEDVVGVIKRALELPTENDDREALGAALCFTLAQLGRAAEGVAYVASGADGVTGGAGVTVLGADDGEDRALLLGAVCRGVAAQAARDDDGAAAAFEEARRASSGSLSDEALLRGVGTEYAAALARFRSGGDAPEASVADYASAAAPDAGGWHAYRGAFVDPGDVDRRTDLLPREFTEEYAARGKPVVAGGLIEDWDAAAFARRALAEAHGQIRVTARGYAAGDWFGVPETLTLEEFLDDHAGPYRDGVRDETPTDPRPYLFERGELGALLGRAYDAYLGRLFAPSDLHDIAESERGATTAIAIGGAGSGCAPHVHGAFYHALVHGATRWFLFPPVAYVPEETTAGALAERLDRGDWPYPRPLQVLLRAGDVLYVPAGWHTAHLNVADAIAVNVQIGSPTHVPLARDWRAVGADETGAEIEANAKTGEMRYAPEADAVYRATPLGGDDGF